MTRDNLLRVLVGVLLLAALAWLVSATEWVEVDVDKPPRGEAAKNDLYATQALLRGLRAQVVRRESLEAMPALDTRLVLASNHWDLFPERARRLRDWVQAGGQLVIPAWMMNQADLEEWLPVVRLERRRDAKRPPRKTQGECRDMTETGDAVDTQERELRLCASQGSDFLQSSQEPLWAVEGDQGTELLRVAFGKGSVTVIGPWDLLNNRRVLRENNALVIASALQVRADADIWFVVEESRETFLLWLWHQAAPGLLLALLALAAALWRGAVRFGPQVTAAPGERRSMTEQVLGTAQFLHRHGSTDLYRAQLRALDETARGVLRHWSRMSVTARADTLAAATGADARALALALDAARPPHRRDLAHTLELLEATRRHLLQHRPGFLPPTHIPPSPP